MGYPKGFKYTICKDCKTAPRVFGSYCKPCHNVRATAWHHKHREEQNAKSLAYYRANHEKVLADAKARRAAHPEHGRDWKMRRLYGISAADVSALYNAQNGRCAVCADAFPERGRNGLHVDHDHKTKAIRGLLCGGCNQGLGRFRDDPTRLRSAAEYLERPR